MIDGRQLERRLKTLERRLANLEKIEVPIVGGGGGAIGGSGTATYLAQFTAATTIGDSDIIDGVTGDDLTISAALTAPRTLTLPDAALTFSDGGTLDLATFTLTVSATGTVALGGGNGAANRVAYWSDVNTITSDAGLQVDAINDLYIVADAGGIGNSNTTARLLFDSSGGTDVAYFEDCNVGVGTTSPASILDVNTSTLPLTLSGTGVGTYTITALYADTTNDVLLDLARITDTSGGTPRNFKIDARGGGEDFFFIQGSTGNVGMGTTSPASLLEIEGDGAKFIVDDSSPFAEGVGGILDLRGRYNTAGSVATFGEIVGGKENGTDGNFASYLDFKTRQNSGSPTSRLRINSSGNVGINETSPDYKLDVAGVIGVDDNVSDPSTVTGKATFYGKDVGGTVEAFAQDDAGNAAQLTAHPTGDLPFTPLPWEHVASYANAYLGIRRYFRIEKALRDLEALTGQQYIYDVEIEKRDWFMDNARRGDNRPKPQWMRDFEEAKQ